MAQKSIRWLRNVKDLSMFLYVDDGSFDVLRGWLRKGYDFQVWCMPMMVVSKYYDIDIESLTMCRSWCRSMMLLLKFYDDDLENLTKIRVWHMSMMWVSKCYDGELEKFKMFRDGSMSK